MLIAAARAQRAKVRSSEAPRGCDGVVGGKTPFGSKAVGRADAA
jgi:hypothetical protein